MLVLLIEILVISPKLLSNTLKR